MLSVIIAAHNEAPRVADVVQAVRAYPDAAEVIVVDDGSTDGTAAAARAAGARVVALPTNQGKGAAMAAGVQASTGDVVAFLDADLVGLRPVHLWRLAYPVASDMAVMTIGRMQMPTPITIYTSGQRAMTRTAALDAVNNGIAQSGYGADAVLLHSASRTGGGIVVVDMTDVQNTQKASKWGAEGLARAVAMPIEVLRHL